MGRITVEEIEMEPLREEIDTRKCSEKEFQHLWRHPTRQLDPAYIPYKRCPYAITTDEGAIQRQRTILECEMNLPLPELVGATSILRAEHIRQLTRQLPARTEGYSWKNIYSTAKHADYSLRNFYHRMSGVDGPVLLVIRDFSGMIFGAFSPCPMKVSEHYYGTGETFLFNFIDRELNVYRWTGENNFFIKGSKNSLTLGGGDGAFGLWLDGDLYRGRSDSCKTFSNPCLAHDEDFYIAHLEAWGFGLV